MACLSDLKPLLPTVSDLIGGPNQHGSLIGMLTRQQLIVDVFRSLLPSQREALARDCQSAHYVLLEYYAEPAAGKAASAHQAELCSSSLAADVARNRRPAGMAAAGSQHSRSGDRVLPQRPEMMNVLALTNLPLFNLVRIMFNNRSQNSELETRNDFT